MAQLLIFGVLVALLAVALQPAHSNRWRPGLSRSNDRDWARLNDELEFLASCDPSTGSGIGGVGSGNGGVDSGNGGTGSESTSESPGTDASSQDEDLFPAA